MEKRKQIEEREEQMTYKNGGGFQVRYGDARVLSAHYYRSDSDPLECDECGKKKKNYWIISFGKASMTVCDKCAEGN